AGVAGAADGRVAGDDGVDHRESGRLKAPARQWDGQRVVDATPGRRADEPDRGRAGIAVATDGLVVKDGAVADDGRRAAGGEDGAAVGGPDVGDRRGGAGPGAGAHPPGPPGGGAGLPPGTPPRGAA